MFERFSTEARDAVVRAQEEARELGADRIAPVHLLLAVAAGSGPGADALRDAGLDAGRARLAVGADDDVTLAALGIDLGQVRGRAEAAFGPGALDRRPRRGHLRFTSGSKRTLQEALRAAVEQGARRLDDRHVLLGVLRVEDRGVAAALGAQDIDLRELRGRLAGRRAA